MVGCLAVMRGTLLIAHFVAAEDTDSTMATGKLALVNVFFQCSAVRVTNSFSIDWCKCLLSATRASLVAHSLFCGHSGWPRA